MSLFVENAFPVSDVGPFVAVTLNSSRVQQPLHSAPFHSWSLGSQENWATFHRTDTGYLIRFDGYADYSISADGRQVTCIPASDVPEATLEHLYLNQVRPLALNRLGCMVFHGGAVVLKGRALAFLAESGRGKSTTTAALAMRGYPFLSDDTLLIEQADRGAYQILPAHPTIRLWNDSRDSVLSEQFGAVRDVDYNSKARIKAMEELPHCDVATPLAAAFFLGDGSASDITVEPMRHAEALIEWTKHSFLSDVEDRAILNSAFDAAEAMATNIPSYRLDFPRSYDIFDRLAEALALYA